MKKVVLFAGGVLALLVALLIVGTLFFFPAAMSDDEGGFFGAGAAVEAEMAMASAEEADSTEDAPAAKMAAVAPEAAPQEAPAAGVAANAKVAAAPAAALAATDGAKVIRNGTLTLVVDDPAAAVTAVEGIIAGMPGAFIAAAEMRRAGDPQPTALTLRVPAASFDQALAALRALAREALAEQTTARDVTEEYTDLDARLRNLHAAEAQLLALVEQADTVEDLLQIEKRLAEVRGEIERLQGRFNVLQDRIALATIRLLLHAPPDLSVGIAAGSPPTARAVTSFALTYRNDGSVPARDGRLTLRLPERLSVYEVGEGGRYDPDAREIQWRLADVAPGAVGSVNAYLRVEATDTDILLEAAIRSASAEADSANNTAAITLTFTPDLALSVEGRAAGAQGSDVPIWIFAVNAGTADATDVTVRAVIPPGLTFVRADAGGGYDRETDSVVWNLGRLEAGAGVEAVMHLRVDAAEGRLRIPIAIAAEQADAVTFNNRADAYVTALREDVSTRSVWRPGRTLETSLAALVIVAQRAVDVLIWLLIFGIPLGLIGGAVYGALAVMRRRRRRRSG